MSYNLYYRREMIGPSTSYYILALSYVIKTIDIVCDIVWYKYSCMNVSDSLNPQTITICRS